jgi:hypothetical protein
MRLSAFNAFSHLGAMEVMSLAQRRSRDPADIGSPRTLMGVPLY